MVSSKASLQQKLKKLIYKFNIYGDFIVGVPFGNGHVNDTFLLNFDQGGVRLNYVLQRINGDVFKEPVKVMENVEESGHEVTGLLGGVNLKSKFRMLLDKNGQPIQNTEIGALERAFVDNGAWDKTEATLIAGDFNQAVYAIRQDVTFDVFREGIIQNSDGSIAYNLLQNDMSALRVVFRFGYAIPNPVTSLDGTGNRYPFSALVPSSEL